MTQRCIGTNSTIQKHFVQVCFVHATGLHTELPPAGFNTFYSSARLGTWRAFSESHQEHSATQTASMRVRPSLFPGLAKTRTNRAIMKLSTCFSLPVMVTLGVVTIHNCKYWPPVSRRSPGLSNDRQCTSDEAFTVPILHHLYRKA